MFSHYFLIIDRFVKRDLVNLVHVIIIVHAMRQAVTTVHSVNLAMHVEVVSDMNVMLVLTVMDLLVNYFRFYNFMLL